MRKELVAVTFLLDYGRFLLLKSLIASYDWYWKLKASLFSNETTLMYNEQVKRKHYLFPYLVPPVATNF